MVMSRNHLATCPLFQIGEHVRPGVGDDWSCINLRLKASSIVIGAAYLDDAVGLNAANMNKLAQMGRFLTDSGLPFLIGGDWNVTPAQLEESGWLAMVGALVRFPAGMQVSCTAGSGNLIDYFVVTPDVQNAAHYIS